MQSINKYTTNEEYTADASRRKALKASTISLIESTGECKIEGYGVFVEKIFAKFGDVVVYDATHGVRFIDHASLPATASETTTMLNAMGVTAVGVVFDNDGDKVYVMAAKAQSARWAEGFIVYVHGVSTSGGGFTLTYNDVVIPITYSSGTLADIATQIKAALDASSLGAHWVVSVDGNDISIAWHWYTPHISSVAISGAKKGETITQVTPMDYQTTLVADVIGEEYPALTVQRRNGYLCGYAGCHHKRFLEYYREKGVEDKKQGVWHWSVLRESVFNEVDNPTVYAHYNGDYEAYIQDQMIKDPTHKGAMIDRESKHNTVRLAGAKYTDIHGVEKPIYPAAYLCHNFDPLALGENSGTNIGLHDWVLPSFAILKKLMEQTEIGGTDALNQTLSKLSGGNCRPESSYIWSSSQYSAANSWFYYAYGSMYYNLKYNSLTVSAVSAF